MTTETLGFTDKAARDEQYRRWSEEKSKGVNKLTTHQGNDPSIIYVVNRSEPVIPSCPEVDEVEVDGGKDVQDNVQDDKEKIGGEGVHEDGETPPGDKESPNSDSGFRDWSA
jgi:hypothetical protein